MTDIRPGSSTQGEFFSGKNETMLVRLLDSDFQRRVGGELSDKQKRRLEKTVKHYMTQYYTRYPKEPVQVLNKEVLQAVVPDYMSYLRRNAGPSVAGAEEEEGNVALRMDVASRFEQLQSERQGGGSAAAAMPAAPDFRISLDAEGPSPLSRFEELKRQREAEAQREAETTAALRAKGALPSQDVAVGAVAARSTGMNEFVSSDIDFRAGIDAAKARDQLALIMRDAERAAAGAAAGPLYPSGPGQTLPDARKLLLSDAPPPLPRQLGIASANPTLALPDMVRERPVLPQDVLKPQDDILAYKETEHNLFIYSADRDWVNNNAENRYNFSVNFDPANNRPGFGFSPAANVKFRNISRIEFVKAIMPVEACDVLPSYTGSTYSTALSPNIFSFPYLQVRIPELNTNGYGTNDGLNNAFAAISYEAYWTADSAAANRGYTRMIPKFLKCQKTFSPTPLATLNKLTFEIQRPDGSLVCQSKDTLDIAGAYMPTTDGAGSSLYVAAGFDWIWLNTSAYFNRFAVSQGDRIVIKNVGLNSTLAANANAAAFISFLTREEGHLVIDIGQITNSGADFTTGPNAVGYANGIVIRNSFADPTTGSTSVSGWVTAIGAAVNTDPGFTKGRLINMNHQIQIILRVITRDMDPSTKLRPDNLQA
jgi:hypothetical protein